MDRYNVLDRFPGFVGEFELGADQSTYTSYPDLIQLPQSPSLRPVDDEGLAFDVVEGYERGGSSEFIPPKPAVVAPIPVIAHDEDRSLGHARWTEVG